MQIVRLLTRIKFSYLDSKYFLCSFCDRGSTHIPDSVTNMASWIQPQSIYTPVIHLAPQRLTKAQRIDKLAKQLEDAKTQHASISKVPVWEKIPLDIADRPFRPDKPCDTDWGLILAFEYLTGGLSGLTSAAISLRHKIEARSDLKRKGLPMKNYQVINEDNQVEFMLLLAQMHPDVLEGIVDGTLFWRILNDKALQKAVEVDHTPTNRPGNYFQAMVGVPTILSDDTPPSGSTTTTQLTRRIENPGRGCGLSMNELHEVWRIAKIYLPESSRKLSDREIEIVSLVDNMYQGNSKNYTKSDISKGLRRYITSGNLHKFEHFLNLLEKQYIGRIEDIKDLYDPNGILDKPMRIALPEVGYGTNVIVRAFAHNSHTSSNDLFSWWQAVSSYVLEGRRKEYAVLRIMTHSVARYDPDNAHVDALIGDTGMTLIARSEYFQGGLNLNPGGGAGCSKSQLKNHLQHIEKNFPNIYDPDDASSRLQLSLKREEAKISVLEKMYNKPFEFDKEMKPRLERHARNQKRFEEASRRMAKLLELRSLIAVRGVRRAVEKNMAHEEEVVLQTSSPVIPIGDPSSEMVDEEGFDHMD